MSGSMLDVTTAIPGQGGPGYTDYPNSGGDFVLFGGLSNNGGPASINTPADWIVVNGHDIARWSGSHGIHEDRYPEHHALPQPGLQQQPDQRQRADQQHLGPNAAYCQQTISSLVVQSATRQTSTLTGYTLNIENNGSGSSNPFGP